MLQQFGATAVRFRTSRPTSSGRWRLAARRGAAALGLLLAAGAPASRSEEAHTAHQEASGGKTTRAPEGATVYFIDLKNGAKTPLKLRVRFGLSGMGVSPAGVDFPGTGHHHLLIDTPLPAAGLPIPADDNHLHLGNGQTEADVELMPGPHTLQLLIGDKYHVPLEPTVASPVIHVVAEAPLTTAPDGAEVYLVGLEDGQTLAPDATLYFGLRGMGVAPADAGRRPSSGHHNLLIDADEWQAGAGLPDDDRRRGFPDGATEAKVKLSPGRHTLQLVFTDADGRPFDPPVASKRVSVVVKGAKRRAR